MSIHKGFGGPLNVARTIAMYEAAGIAGCHIEDQTFPKRCGQLEGKHVVSIEEYTERIVRGGFFLATQDYAKDKPLHRRRLSLRDAILTFSSLLARTRAMRSSLAARTQVNMPLKRA
jgi:hypothetical protein